MAERIDKEQISKAILAELYEGGKILLTETPEDPFLLTIIELDASAATKLYDFLLLHMDRLHRHAQAQKEVKSESETPPTDRPFFSSYLLPGRPSDEESAEQIARYNAEMDERNRIIRENVEKPWLPLHDSE